MNSEEENIEKEFSPLRNFWQSLNLRNEDSEEFKQELKRKNLEEDVVHLTHYNLPTELILLTLNPRYLFIDKKIYIEIERILKTNLIPEAQNDIAFILKFYLYKNILFNLNKNTNAKMIDFNKQFHGLYKLLESNITNIKFETNQKKEEVRINDESLIKIILDAFRRYALNDGFAWDHITYIETGQYMFDFNSQTIVDKAIFNLFLYIQTKTSFIGNLKDNQNLKDPRFSNAQCLLVHELLLAAKIINDKDSIPDKDFMRNRIKRFIRNNKHFVNYFDTNKKYDPWLFDNKISGLEYLERLLFNKAKNENL